MASNIIPKTYITQKCYIPHDEMLEPGVCWSSYLEVPSPSKSEPTTPRRFPEDVQQNSTKHTVMQVLEDQKLVCHQDGPSDSLPITKAINECSNLVASLSKKPAAKQFDPVEELHSHDAACFEVNERQKSKASDHSGMKNSSTSTKNSDDGSSLTMISGSGKNSERVDFVESGKSSMCRGSTSSDVSDESTCSSMSNSINKPHKANDSRWEAIQVVRAKDGQLGLSHFRLLKRLGCGDIGSVYLSELSGTQCYFAMKVMDKTSLATRKKLLRAQTENEILQCLDHPFLPTLYTHFETEKFSCLVMEFCPGGDLHALRQKRPGKYFPEQAVREAPLATTTPCHHASPGQVPNMMPPYFFLLLIVISSVSSSRVQLLVVGTHV